MSKEIRYINPQLSYNLKHAKETLAEAERLVEAAEGAIYIAAGELPEEGTVHCTGVKISLGFYQKWADEELQKAETVWPQVSNLPFPFKKTYKADSKAINYLRENAPSAYDAISPALTLTPKKPSFQLTDKE